MSNDVAQICLAVVTFAGSVELIAGVGELLKAPRRTGEGLRGRKSQMHVVRGGLAVLTGSVILIVFNAGSLGPLSAVLITLALIFLEGFAVSTLYGGVRRKNRRLD